MADGSTGVRDQVEVPSLPSHPPAPAPSPLAEISSISSATGSSAETLVPARDCLPALNLLLKLFNPGHSVSIGIYLCISNAGFAIFAYLCWHGFGEAPDHVCHTVAALWIMFCCTALQG